MAMLIRSLSVFIYFMLFLFTVTGESHCFSLNERVHEFTLRNGLKVLLMQRHNAPTVSCALSFKTGAVDETSGFTGVAHLLEHMLFKGTSTIGTRNYKEEAKLLEEISAVGKALDAEKKKSQGVSAEAIGKLTDKLKTLEERHRDLFIENEIDAIYSRNGAEGLNAGTGFDSTTYTVSLPSNRLELWARIESDRFTHPVFRQYYLERDVVLEELRQSYETKPERKLMTQFLAAAFNAHPYGRPIIGWPSDIAYLPQDVCADFFKAHYVPNNAVVSIVGDLNIDETKRIMENYFAAIPARALPEANITVEPEQIGERRIRVMCDAEPAIIIGYHKPTVPEADDYVFDVLDSILSGGRTSRLYKSLVLDKKIAMSVETSNGFPGARYPNLFIIKVLPSQSSTYATVEKAVYEQFESLLLGPITDEELLKVKKQLKTDFLHRLRSNAELAGMLSYYQTVCNDWRYLEKQLEAIDAVTAVDIQTVIRKYCISSNRTVAFLVKVKEHD